MSAHRPDPLITVAELAAALAGEAPGVPVVLDVRWRTGGPSCRVDYLAGHLPGAAFVELEEELTGPPGAGGRHPLPAPERFGAAMRAHGVSRGRPVVAYDFGGTLSAARAWWLLRYFGHENARVLDGGITAWTEAGHALDTAAPSPTPGDFEAEPGHMPVLDAAGAGQVAGRGILLDSRAPERFRGETEPLDPVAGHIPGARSHPAALDLDERGRFLAPAQLRARLADAGLDGAQAVGAYCGSGVTASQTVLALALAGYRAALYPGSWSEWVSDPARPVAVGP